MGIGGPSPTLGSNCEKCMRKFTIHFRRNSDEIYDGSFGFDWYRPEFFKKITPYRANSEVPYGNKEALVSGSILTFKNTYLTDQITKISPYNMEYIPAWLAIYPNVINNGNGSYLSKNPEGITLNLELIPLKPDNDLPLVSDGTYIQFEVSNEKIIIEPKKINIDDFIYANKFSRDVGGENEEYYVCENIVKIKCESPIDKHEEIMVYSIKGDNKEVVGKVMVYKNSIIPTFKVRIVDYITDGTRMNRSSDYEDFLKFKSFNQALINVEIVKELKFDLTQYSKSDPEVAKSLYRIYVEGNKSYLLDDIDKHFKKYGDPNFKSKNYIFLTTLDDVGGASDLNDKVVLGPKSVSLFNAILVHELGHNRGLEHIFESQILAGKKFIFLKGTTSNFLDYDYNESVNMLNIVTHSARQRLSYFFKYQWDIMRKKLGA